MTDGKCNYCDEEFKPGQSIIVHDDKMGTRLEFCGSDCAGNHYVENECVGTTYYPDEI